MGGWHDIQNEVALAQHQGQRALDAVRHKYLAGLHALTGRNTIVYYSGWLQKPDLVHTLYGRAFAIHDGDKHGFMSVIKGMDKKLGLDLILHTPGGEVNATESLVEYLHSKFADIRVIIPQMAMSAGTMIACAANTIVMGDHSSIGPIDPQIGGCSAHGFLEEFDRARDEMKADPTKIPLWTPILQKYDPTLIGECQKAMTQAISMVTNWLKSRMFKRDAQRDAKAKKVVDALSDHATTFSHGRHFSKVFAKGLGLRIVSLEAHKPLQEAVLSVHHACILTLSSTHAVKIIQNHSGVAYIEQFQGNS